MATTQVSIRLTPELGAQLDAVIRRGRYPSRYALVQEALRRLLREEREEQIADGYRRAYAEHPSEEALDAMSAALLTAAIEREGADLGSADL